MKKTEFHWECKNHILVDCISELPIFEITTPANTSDCAVTLDILEKTHKFLSISEGCFLADKAYDVKYICNAVKQTYDGEYYMPRNKVNTKNPNKLPSRQLKLLFILLTIKTGADPRKIIIAQNTLLFLMITDFKSIYQLRTEARHHNLRFKQLDCERTFVRNGN